MDKNSNNYYLENINHKIEKLDIIKKQHEEGLIELSKVLEHNNSVTQKLEYTNSILHDHYASLIRLVEEQGMIFEMNFTNYNPHQWENLLIVKVSNGYAIKSKTGSSLMMLDKKYSNIISDVTKKQSQSLIVIRVTEKMALVQLRFN